MACVLTPRGCAFLGDALRSAGRLVDGLQVWRCAEIRAQYEFCPAEHSVARGGAEASRAALQRRTDIALPFVYCTDGVETHGAEARSACAGTREAGTTHLRRPQEAAAGGALQSVLAADPFNCPAVDPPSPSGSDDPGDSVAGGGGPRLTVASPEHRGCLGLDDLRTVARGVVSFARVLLLQWHDASTISGPAGARPSDLSSSNLLTSDEDEDGDGDGDEDGQEVAGGGCPILPPKHSEVDEQEYERVLTYLLRRRKAYLPEDEDGPSSSTDGGESTAERDHHAGGETPPMADPGMGSAASSASSLPQHGLPSLPHEEEHAPAPEPAEVPAANQTFLDAAIGSRPPWELVSASSSGAGPRGRMPPSAAPEPEPEPAAAAAAAAAVGTIGRRSQPPRTWVQEELEAAAFGYLEHYLPLFCRDNWRSLEHGSDGAGFAFEYRDARGLLCADSTPARLLICVKGDPSHAFSLSAQEHACMMRCAATPATEAHGSELPTKFVLLHLAPPAANLSAGHAPTRTRVEVSHIVEVTQALLGASLSVAPTTFEAKWG